MSETVIKSAPCEPMGLQLEIESTHCDDFRVLFLTWSELDITSGTPVIIRDLLAHFPAEDAEVLVEANVDSRQHRLVVDIKQTVRKYGLHAKLWPFRRGHRVRNWLARLGMPFLVAQILLQIRRFRPACLFVVYAQPHWIAASWLASRISGVPLIYHVHDAFLEAFERRKRSPLFRWLERTTLTQSRVLTLDDTMAEHYRGRYGIECTMLRHIVRHAPLNRASDGRQPGHAIASPSATSRRRCTIGFAGAIYDSNSKQLADLCQLVNADPSLKLRIWTGATADHLAAMGIGGAQIEIGFTSDYDQLLQNLAGCDLLYLPLHFDRGATAAAGAMEFSLPTKTFDYLLAGTPILVHCPEHFSLSRFFRKYPCGYVVNVPGSEAVAAWLSEWRDGQIESIDDQVRRDILRMYDPQENKRILWGVFSEEVAKRQLR